MNSNEAKINQEENIKDINPKNTEQKNQTEKIQKVNHCLPSFLTDDDYFKDNSNSIEEEESNEEKSVDNKKDNSTREDSNKILNYPQNNIISIKKIHIKVIKIIILIHHYIIFIIKK